MFKVHIVKLLFVIVCSLCSLHAYSGNIIRISAPISAADQNTEPPVTDEPQVVGYQIVNPSPGIDGIYTIKSEYGADFQAYVDMTRDGGNWILHSKWAGVTPTLRTFSDAVQLQSPMTTYSDSPGTHPVIPTGMMNPDTSFMFVSENASWRSRAGDWQVFQGLPADFKFNSAGFPARSSNGTLSVLYNARGGWKESGTMQNSVLGFFTVWGTSSPCGGAYVTGNSSCPIMRNTTWTGNHYDFISNKYLFVKATN